MWNELIKIRDKYSKRLVNANIESKSYKNNIEIRSNAETLLRQYNTAGGKELMKHEVENFINKFGG